MIVMREGKREDYNLGDVVRIRGTAPGPAMTITGFEWRDRSPDAPQAICQWIITRTHPITGAAEHVIACRTVDIFTLTKEPRDQVF